MEKFKIGDKVRVIHSFWPDVKIGEIWTVLTLITKDSVTITHLDQNKNPSHNKGWHMKNDQLKLLNSTLIKERLGVK